MQALRKGFINSEYIVSCKLCNVITLVELLCIFPLSDEQ